jgi:predicted CopG family antitoxin
VHGEVHVAVKKITIDMDAYRLLDAEKRTGESFSKVIKRKLGDSTSAADVLRHLDRVALEESTLDRFDEVLRARNDSMVKPLRMDEA